MPEPRLIGLGRAVPERQYVQSELLAHSPWSQSSLVDRLFLDAPIHTRGFFVPPEWYFSERSLSDTNRAWREGALLLGEASLRDALSRCSVRHDQLDFLGVTTVTGYTTPGLDLLLARAMKLRPNLRRAHFNNIGCHAAVPLLKVTADHVARHGGYGVATAVEVCSACFSDSEEAQNIVAVSLFADGAASAVVSASGVGPRILGFSSRYDFDQIDALGFDLTTGGFRIVLDPAIPHVIAQHIEAAVDEVLSEHAVSRDQVSLWALHPGGSRILDAAQTALRLTDADLLASRTVLRNHGNMSSPSVFFVLAEALRSGLDLPGHYGVIASFGPGLGIEVALLGF